MQIAFLTLKGAYLPRVVEFYEGEWRSSSVLQVAIGYFSEFVKQIFNVSVSDIWGQISNVDPALIIPRHTHRHIHFECRIC